MRLTKTNSGNYAKQATITGGGKWSFCGNFATLEKAEAAAQIHRDKGRQVSVTEEITSKSQSKKHGGPRIIGGKLVIVECPVGQKFYRVEAYIVRGRQVMVHASTMECEAAGVTAGPCNL